MNSARSLKIFAAGIATETNTFCPVPTSLDDFQIQRGRDALAGRICNPTLDLAQTWGEQARARGDLFVFSLMASARPAGITVRSAYESLRDEMMSDLQVAMPVDIVLLMLHGAMLAQGYDGCEEDMIRRVRGIVGPETVIAVELDLHCHLSESMIAAADLVITYKEYPHVDVNARARELFDLAVKTKLGHIHPTMALFDCRMVGLFPTSRQPLRGFVEDMIQAEQRKEVLSISFGHGFQFADVPHVGAKVLVVTNNDSARAHELAREFGLRVFAMRHQISFDSLSLPLDQALTRALSGARTPVVVADQSDNSGGGAPGDATYALRWLLDHQVSDAALAIFYDPEVVKIARKAGLGASLPVRLGGKMGPSSGDPVDLDVTVVAILQHYLYAIPQQSGPPLFFPIGDVAALRCGTLDIVMGSKRFQCSSPSIFSDLGIDPKRKRLLVVKSTQHFNGAFARIAGEVIYMAAPGAVAPDPRLIPYRRLNTRKLYPWVSDPFAEVRS